MMRSRRKPITLDPQQNRTYDYWHVFVPGVEAGQLYGYRVSGPNDPAAGLAIRSPKTPRGSVRTGGREHRELSTVEGRRRRATTRPRP